jgi:predicted nucleotidyltransferase
MEYNISIEELQSDLLAETLHELSICYAELGTEVYVVGAAARDLAMRLLKMQNAPRRTLDLDVAVLLQDWQQYKQLTTILLHHHFIKASEKQRFIYQGTNGKNQYEVDIVPFGAIAIDEQVAWPPEGSPIMSVRCFEDVMNGADIITVDNRFSFRMASLSGQFIIKLDTWQDRHLKTKKDAADMVYILQNIYVAYALNSNGLPPEIDINTEQFDVTVAGAEWIAAELKKILTPEHRRYYATLLQKELDIEENSVLMNDMLDMSDSRNYMLFRRALSRIVQILCH